MATLTALLTPYGEKMTKKNENKTQAIERAKPPARGANDWLLGRSDSLAKWCVEGSGLDALTLVRVGTMVVQREEKFHDPKTWPSLYIALITAAQLGLEPAGPMSEAYILPYWDAKAGTFLAQLQPGYRGLIKLMTQGGTIKTVRSHVVHENDVFRMALGSKMEVVHEPCWKGDPGPPVAVYSIVKYHDGDEDYELAPWSDVQKARESSKGKSPAWDKWPEQMARKFIIKRHANQLPLSPVAKKAVTIDNIDAMQGAALETQHVIDDQNVLDINLIEAPPEPKEQSRLAGKLSGRSKGRTKVEAEAPPQKVEEKEEELPEMCGFCGTNPTDKTDEPCKQCSDEISEGEAKDAEGAQES